MLLPLLLFVPFLADGFYYGGPDAGELALAGLYCLHLLVSVWLLARPVVQPGRPVQPGLLVLLCGGAWLINWNFRQHTYDDRLASFQYPPLVLMGLALLIAVCERLWPSKKE